MYGNKVKKILEVLEENGGELKLNKIVELSGFDRKYVCEVLSKQVVNRVLSRVRRGYYKVIGKPSEQKYKVMWRFLRAEKTVSGDDLVEISGASYQHVRRFLDILLKRDSIRENKNKTYTLIQKDINPPSNWTEYEGVKGNQLIKDTNLRVLKELKSIKLRITILINDLEKKEG
jgi:hypothetical protein